MAVDIRVPPLGESLLEATVGQWLKREGDAVAAGEPVVELETEKVNLQVTADASGRLEHIVKPVGVTVQVGDVLGSIALGDEKPADVSPADEPEHAPVVSPVARRMAVEHGIDVAALAGTGPAGRVVQADVERYLAQHPTTPIAPTAAPPPAGSPSLAPLSPAPPSASSVTSDKRAERPPLETAPLPTDTRVAPRTDRPEERVRVSRRRLTIARRLVEAQHETASLTTFNEIDMTAVMELRRRRKESFQARHGIGLGFMSFFVKAAVAALKSFPNVNAEMQGEEIILKHYYDIGVAVDTEGGLVVPVARAAERKSFAEIEREIAELARRARENQLTLDELRGGTFTITNGGIFGSLFSTPIINPPQVAILGMHRIAERPVAVNGQVVIHAMMYVALTYDHRVIDGRIAVQFLVRVKELIEDPETLLLDS